MAEYSQVTIPSYTRW